MPQIGRGLDCIDEVIYYSQTTLREKEGLASDNDYEDSIESFKAESVPAGSGACESVTVYDEEEGCGNPEDSVTWYNDFGFETLPNDVHHDSSCFDVRVRG